MALVMSAPPAIPATWLKTFSIANSEKTPKSLPMCVAEQLCTVDFGCGEKSGHHADQHRRQTKYCRFGLSTSSDKCRNAIEADISEHGHRRSVEHAADDERLRVRRTAL